MTWNRSTFIVATIGAAATGYLAVAAFRRLSDGNARGSAYDEREQGSDMRHRSTRSAGPAAMRDPQHRWDEVDQSLDESFPASDPTPALTRVD